MLIRKATQQAIESAASEAGVTLRNFRPNKRGHGYRFQLALADKRGDGTRLYQRLNHRLQRKVAAVCWHGHRDFFRLLFDACPAAVVITAFIRYDGAADFDRRFWGTYANQIGSQAEPCKYGDACTCNGEIRNCERPKGGWVL